MKRIVLAALLSSAAFSGMARADTVILAHAQPPGNPRSLTSTSANVIQMTANSQGATAQIVPELNVIGLPFLFGDAPTAWSVIDGDIKAMIDEAPLLASTGRPLGPVPAPLRPARAVRPTRCR